MNNLLEDIELRSEEVQDVLGQIPNWMIRWGSTLFFVLILLVLVISWVVKYPDIIQAETIITTRTPPQKEFAVTTGKLDSIYVEEAQMVKKNTLLAVLENPANTMDVYYLKSILDSLSIDKSEIRFPIDEIPILLLGGIETAYASFENSYMEYELNKALRPFNNETTANEVSLDELRIRLRNMQSQHALNRTELEFEAKKFRT